MRRYGWLVAALALLVLWAWARHEPQPGLPAPATPATRADVPIDAPAGATRDAPAWLPAQAARTLRLIERGGPFPHRQDGSVFQNREGRLPAQPRGWYREYTVETPGSPDRGARRIIAGGDPPSEFFYTGDHYRSFRRIPAEVTR